MDLSLPDEAADETGNTLPRVTVRYWAAARAAAGRAEDQISAATVSEALAQVQMAHADDARFLRVLEISSLLLGDRPVARGDVESVQVADADVLEVLPPFAGG
jgi:sulfur-carrier protein